MKISRRDFSALAGGMVAGLGSMVARPVLATPAPFYTAYVYPGSPIPFSEKALRAHGETAIALTFDDGPDPGNDGVILQLLAQYKAVATFFVIGSKAARHLDLIQAMVTAGCEIGNHSWSHPMLTHLSLEDQATEMRKTNALLADANIKVNWLRPPYGDYDHQTRAIAEKESMETILWSIDPSDWKSPPANTIATRITRNLAPGAIVLMHSTRAHSVKALPRILEFATANHYRFVTLSEWKHIMLRANAPAT
jgi:peptidoglycan/xylan/chitin deacetylase (PgdA/CDA1 family)